MHSYVFVYTMRDELFDNMGKHMKDLYMNAGAVRHLLM